MSYLLEDVYFTSDSFDIGNITNFALLKDFYSNFFSSLRMDAEFDFPESSLSQVSGKDVIANGAGSLECSFLFFLRHE